MSHCAAISMISKYYDTIIQLMTKEISNHYNLQYNSTKCLNTCVILIYILFGAKQMMLSKSCNTHEVRARKSKTLMFQSDTISNLEKSLVRRNRNGSVFYYVMLTDAHLPLNDTNIYFPGHTFIIEKTVSRQYFIYQSYINNYNLHSYMQKQSCKPIDLSKMKQIIANLKTLCNGSYVWNDDMIKFWKDFTNVDTRQFRGARLQGIHFCFKRYSSNTLHTNLERFTSYFIKRLDVLIKKQAYDYYKDVSNSIKSLSIFTLKNNVSKLRNGLITLDSK